MSVEAADYYDKVSHYDILWGKDNIHLGLYPHIADRRQRLVLDVPQAAMNLTRRMIELADIGHDSVVLDLGCGKGLACKLIAEITGATIVGVDLSEVNIKRCKDLAAENPDLKMEFIVGNLLDLPKELHGRFSHVFSQEVLYHVHEQLDVALGEVEKVLQPKGLVVMSDLLGGDAEMTPEVKESVYDALRMDFMLSHSALRRVVDDKTNFVIRNYENLDRHSEFAYSQLAKAAEGFDTVDGTSLAKDYERRSKALSTGHFGKVLAVLSL